MNWHGFTTKSVRGLVRLHKIVKGLGLGEKEIIKVLELAKYDELQNLQWKVEYLRNEVNMLENEKWKSTNKICTYRPRTALSHLFNNIFFPSTNFPSYITASIFFVLLISLIGFAASTIISASFPGSIVPTLFKIPKASAPFRVAILITSKGLIPASTKSSSS